MEDVVIPRVMEDGGRVVNTRVSTIMEELVGDAWEEIGYREVLNSSRLEKADQKRESLTKRLERRNEAEKQRKNLMERLEILWSSMETGMPELDITMETHPSPQTTTKRKRECTRTERRLVREGKDSRRLATSEAEMVINIILDEISIHHDCGVSAACPAWLCEKFQESFNMEKEISRLEKILTNLELGDEMNKLTLPTRDGWKKSPVKELINIFENKLSMTRSPSNSQDNSRQEVGRIKFDKIKIFEKEDGQEQQTDTHNMVTVVNTNSNASNIPVNKPRKENCIPDGRKIGKQRVWTTL